MDKPKYLFLFLALLLSQMTLCQQAKDENKTKVAAVLENYFDLEREAIHLHIDKTTFLNSEAIWYQGYILNRKTNKPFFTTNVYILLYDEAGNQLSEKLIYANDGIFSGKIALNAKMHSGNYYLQAYTNWMNNFSENESTITKVNIINPEEGVKNYKKTNLESLEITLTPEGKSYLAGVSNFIGVQVKDCRGNTLENLEAALVNAKGEIIKTFKLNRFGLGKFEITPTEENLKVVVTTAGKTLEKALPVSEKIGFALDVNNFTVEGKTIIKVKTNSATANLMQDKKLYLIVHQDQKQILNDISLAASFEQVISLNNSDIAEGINTIRLIDSNLKEWSQRLIYNNKKLESTPINIIKNDVAGNKLNIVGYSSHKNSSISIAVLPEGTKSWDGNNSIISGLLINPYLIEPLANADYYFNSPGRSKFYELDLALFNQGKPKYEWSYMATTVPASNYSFDIGLGLKGKINPKISNKTYHKVKLLSKKDLIMMASDVTEEGDYLFEHILLGDSTYVSMSLQKLPNFEVIDNVFTPQVLDRKKPFYKPFRINLPEHCENVESESVAIDFDLPKFGSNVIVLKEVTINNDKPKLSYENKLGNGNLRGYKVDETMKRKSLLNFLEYSGFKVVRNMGSVTVYSRGKSTLNSAQAQPLISIDERAIVSHDELGMMMMDEIDEIYLNPYAIVPSIHNYQGVIKIYTKKIPGKSYQKADSNSFYIQNGYARNSNFKNADYQNSQSQGFDNFALLDWSPRILSDEEGQFKFDITDYHKPKGKVILEGMTTEGELFYEEKTIDLQ